MAENVCDISLFNSNIISITGMIEAQLKSGWADVGASENPTLATETVKETVTMLRVSEKPDNNKQAIAEEMLELSKVHLEKASNLRARHARLAREYGLTNQRIGEILGVTEARVRQLIKEVS